jgi:hypothetical protein
MTLPCETVVPISTSYAGACLTSYRVVGGVDLMSIVTDVGDQTPEVVKLGRPSLRVRIPNPRYSSFLLSPGLQIT